MKKVGFIGAYDKSDFILYVAKLLSVVNKKVLIFDTTITQKMKYIVPVINPTLSYVTDFEGIDIAVGFKSIEEISFYLGNTEKSELNYDFILIDIDTSEYIDDLDMNSAFKKYFVTSFDTYSIKRGLEILSNLTNPIGLTKVLFSKEMLKDEDEYLNYLSLGYKIIWNEFRIYFPFETSDQIAIIENQRISKIKFKNLSSQYKESLTYVVEDILEGENHSDLRKTIRLLERGE